ncbi:MAG: hypothetical protein P8J87_20170, partial [Verrucomicrobiales bacterium]|nr:hypothetical protein [Verrucomicrobiales bacterium]
MSGSKHGRSEVRAGRAGLPENLEAFLEKHPWPEGTEKGGRVVEALWLHDFRSSRAELWPFLSDTSAINKKLGLPKMSFEERDGKLYG